MDGFEVAGRRFRTEADYRAALRDQDRIDAIKARVDMEQPGEVIALYADMQAGKYRFETIVGNDFDDEIYELAQEYKRRGFEAGGSAVTAKQRKKDRKTPKTRSAVKEHSQQKPALESYSPEMQREILHEMKKREKYRKAGVILCAAVAAACFGYFGVYCFFSDRTRTEYQDLAQLKETGPVSAQGTLFRTGDPATGEEEPELQILDEYKTLYQKNKKMVGWLKIEDTDIDYPVMQTVNNEYYLDHNFDQEYDKNGSLFLDKDCDIVHRNTNLIIYGHHMKSGRMFGNLNQYSSKDYYEKHSKIQFDTIYEKGIYEVMYVFRSRIYNEDEIVFKYYQFLDAESEKEFDSDMQEMAALALYDTGVTASYGDQLLTLSTCDNSETDGRFVVVAKRVE